MESLPHRSGLSITGLVMAGLSLFSSLVTACALAPVQADPTPSGSPMTGGYVIAAGLLVRVVMLVVLAGLGLVWTVLAVVFGAVGATRASAPWQRVSFWVYLPLVLTFQLLAIVVGVCGVMAAAHR